MNSAREDNPDVSVGFSEVLRKAMALDKSLRYESAKAMALALRAIEPPLRSGESNTEVGVELENDRDAVAGRLQSGGQIAGAAINDPPHVRPKIDLKPVIAWRLELAETITGTDYYDFNVSLHNAGETTARDFCVNVEVPNAHARPCGAEVRNHPSATTCLYRRTQNELNNLVLYPGSTELVLQLTYLVTRQHYRDGITGCITVSTYVSDRLVDKTDYPIVTMLNKEREAHLLGQSQR